MLLGVDSFSCKELVAGGYLFGILVVQTSRLIKCYETRTQWSSMFNDNPLF